MGECWLTQQKGACCVRKQKWRLIHIWRNGFKSRDRLEIRKKQRLKAFLQIPNVSLPEFLNSPVERGKKLSEVYSCTETWFVLYIRLPYNATSALEYLMEQYRLLLTPPLMQPKDSGYLLLYKRWTFSLLCKARPTAFLQSESMQPPSINPNYLTWEMITHRTYNDLNTVRTESHPHLLQFNWVGWVKNKTKNWTPVMKQTLQQSWSCHTVEQLFRDADCAYVHTTEQRGFKRSQHFIVCGWFVSVPKHYNIL